MGKRAGINVVNFKGDLQYKSFSPTKLPISPSVEMTEDIVNKLVLAHRYLEKLENIADFVPSATLFLVMYIRREAVLSSQIEGTQATFDDVADMDLKESAELEEVANYIQALNYAVKNLERLPICLRLLKEVHGILMSGVRGQEKTPGEIRTSQNWIGGSGSSLKTARYIPPNIQDLQDGLANLEEYINEEEPDDDPLIRIALIHYQFETLHPFLDGNGRIGRMLIILYLLEKKVITRPLIYPSYFLKLQKIEYFDRLTEVRNKGDYEQWVLFFLTAVEKSAQDAIETILQLTKLHEENIQKIESHSKSTSNMLRLLAQMEKFPRFSINNIAQELEITDVIASRLIKEAIWLGMVEKVSDGAGNQKFIYAEYLDILRHGTDLE